MTVWEDVDTLYGNAGPNYLEEVGRTHIVIRASQWEGAAPQLVRITPADVVVYYATEARNITSGCRTLAGFTSDWRGVDAMAKECLEIFKVLNRKALEREGKKHGMELRA